MRKASVSNNSKKPWQKGYELDYLKTVASTFNEWNRFSLSPFSKIKKNNVADALSKKELDIGQHSIIKSKVSKSGSTIYYLPGVPLTNKAKGDRTVDAIAVIDPRGWKEAQDKLASYKENTWVYCWAEDERYCKLIQDSGYIKVGAKITSFAEVHAIFYKPANVATLVLFTNGGVEHHNLTKVLSSVPKATIESIRKKLEGGEFDFTNHYSNYNKRSSWSALALRGYSKDPGFITKPSEMNEAWLEEHKNENFKLQDTKLRKQFPEVEELLKPFDGCEIHRIRLMRLAPGNGELARHTDQVDEDSGVADGKLVRLHWPIKTNPNVIFNSWDDDGRKVEVHMEAGTCWYLDTRKPHRAENTGKEERIHLVVDIVSNQKIRDMISNGVRA